MVGAAVQMKLKIGEIADEVQLNAVEPWRKQMLNNARRTRSSIEDYSLLFRRIDFLPVF